MPRSNPVNTINRLDLESVPRKENKIVTTQKTVEA